MTQSLCKRDTKSKSHPGCPLSDYRETNDKQALYLSVNVFSTKVLIGDIMFTSPTGDGTTIQFVAIRATRR